MAEYTRDEAMAFLDAMRLAVTGRTGFKWLVERLGDLGAYIDAISGENERLNAFIDSIGARADFEAAAARRDGPEAP